MKRVTRKALQLGKTMKQPMSVFTLLALAQLAANAAGISMPWNTGLTAISNNVTGPTALGLVTVGGFAAFAPMVFHGEIAHFAHRASYWVLTGGGLLAIPTVTSFLGITGAIV